MRKFLAIASSVVLALAIVAPVSADTVTEGLTLPGTISMTVPSSPVTYTYSAVNTRWEVILTITGLTTNNPSGMNVTQTVSTLVNTNATLPTTVRGRQALVAPTGWTATNGTFGAQRMPPFYATSATVDSLATTSVAQPTAGTFGYMMFVPAASVVVPGAYAGTLTITAATNP